MRDSEGSDSKKPRVSGLARWLRLLGSNQRPADQQTRPGLIRTQPDSVKRKRNQGYLLLGYEATDVALSLSEFGEVTVRVTASILDALSDPIGINEDSAA